MTTRNRPQLKSFFVKNAIPTEGNFADLIESQLNQSEDGIFKSPGDSLAVVAAGDSKRVLRLFGAPPPAAPDWQLSLNPPQTAGTPQSSRLGLGVSDGAGNLRLFVDATTGNLGVGTNAPAAPLEVRVPGVVNSDRLLVDATTAWDGQSKHLTLASANAGQLNLHNPHVPWLGGESRASIRFGRSGGVASGNFWDVGTRAGNAFSISLNGGADPKLTVLANGNVGIGTPNPAMRLEISGNANIAGTLTVAGFNNSGSFSNNGALNTQSLVATGNVQANSASITTSLASPTITTTTLTASGTATAATLTATTATATSLAATAAALGTPSRFGVSVTRSNQKVALPGLPNTLVVSLGLVIQAWVYFNVFEEGVRIIELGNSGNTLDTISLSISAAGQLCAQYTVNGQSSVMVASAINALKVSTWQLVALSISDTGLMRLFVNNTQVGTTQHLPLRNVQRLDNVLCKSIAPSQTFLSGAVGDVSLWVGPVAPPVTTPLVGNEPRLAAWWRLNGGGANSCLNPPGYGGASLSFVGESVLPIFVLLHDKTQPIAVASENWIPIVLPANWFSLTPVAYFKDALGMVHLRGSMQLQNAQPYAIGLDPLPTVLPLGYRPAALESHPIVLYDRIGRLDILPEGQIVVKLGHTWLTCLDGIHFRAGG